MLSVGNTVPKPTRSMPIKWAFYGSQFSFPLWFPHLPPSVPTRACTHKRGFWRNARFLGEAEVADRQEPLKSVEDDP